ncbi:MAG: hypothetical protein Fur0040_08620 [Sideroxydans sp.]
MSLINQVLNDLERRGETPEAGQMDVRAVPVASASAVWWWVFGAAALLLLALGLWWIRLPTAAPDDVAEAARDTLLAASAPGPAMPVTEIVSEVVAAVELAPASKLSFELSQVPPDEPSPPPRAVATRSSAPAPVAASAPATTVPLKQISAAQKADAEYRKALAAQRQGQTAQALASFVAALELSPTHQAARLAYAALLVENRRFADAERTLQEGLQLDAADLTLTMALARTQVEQGDTARALATLESSLARAEGKADYHAFYAALLQRLERHQEAITHYRIALQLVPSSGVWWMGYGISLQALARAAEAREAYQQALATHTLNPQLTAFVEQKLKGF